MGYLFIISGPSGSGKTTLAEQILREKELIGRLKKSVSFTTRPMRSGEKDKKDYFFITEKEFKQNLRAKKILEWTRYLGYYYATPKEFVDGVLVEGKHVLLCVDLKGVAKLTRLYRGKTVTIFVMPPSIEELDKRIRKRCHRVSGREIKRRIEMAKREILVKDSFDYCLVNEDLAAATRQLERFILNKITKSSRRSRDPDKTSGQ